MTRIPFDPDAIRALAAVLAETGLSEIEIAEKDSRIRVVRAGVSSAVTVAPIVAAPLPVPAVAPPRDEASHPGAVTSPRSLKHFGIDLGETRLCASDIDWSYGPGGSGGSGSEVSGSAADLALVLCGRTLPAGRLQGAIPA